MGIKKKNNTTHILQQLRTKEKKNLKEETKNLSTSMFALGFFVVHDSSTGSEDNESELSRWQQVVRPSFHIFNSNIKSWRDNTTFVQTTVELNNNLACSVVINTFVFSNVAVFLHDIKEL